jgi:hypothetical protein
VSALDGLIRRLMAQRACLERAAELVADRTGPAVQLGWGDGSAYDHLREVLGQREIVVFDQEIPATAALSETQRVAGDLRNTLPLAWDRFPRGAALAHVNFPVSATPRLAADIGPLLSPLLQAGAVVVIEPALDVPGWEKLPLPEGVRDGRHHLYRAG